MNTMKMIEIPEGKTLVKVDDDTYKLVENNTLPSTWVEFCMMNPDCSDEYRIDFASNIKRAEDVRDYRYDRNLLSSKEQAESVLAFIQLLRLRDCYNSTAPAVDCYRFYITRQYGEFKIECAYSEENPRVMVFNTYKLAEQFLDNFRDLIEKAKNLI